MKILNKNGAKISTTDSGLTAEEIIVILIIALFALTFVFLLCTVGHWLYEDYLSNLVQFIPAN